MRRCNIQILPLTFPDSVTCTPTAVFIRSRAWVTDGNLMASGWAGHRSTTAIGFMGRNLDGPLLEVNRGDGCLITMVAGFLNLGSAGCGFRPDSAAALYPLNSIPSRQPLCVPAVPWQWFPLTRWIAAARRR